jgi:hypothetical protein
MYLVSNTLRKTVREGGGNQTQLRVQWTATMPTPTFRRPLLALALIIPALPAQTPSQAPKPPAKASVTRASIAGLYDGHQMEVGAELLLKPDGHFKYELAYGALDESAEGTWEIKSNVVLLTTVPAVKPPEFVVVSDTPDPSGGLYIKLVKPVEQGARQRIYLIYAPTEQPDFVEVADDGRVPFPGGRRPTAIVPEIPVYPTISKAIPLTGTGGHRMTLRFEPNDIGRADFRALPLPIEDGELVMTRPDLQLKLTFKRTQAGPDSLK